MKIILISIFVISLQLTALAQGQFVDKGTKAFGISVAFLAGENGSGFGLAGGYSFNGMFDLGLSYSRLDIEEDLEIEYMNPQLSLHFVKTRYVRGAISIGLSSASYIGEKSDVEPSLSGVFATAQLSLCIPLEMFEIYPYVFAGKFQQSESYNTNGFGLIYYFKNADKGGFLFGLSASGNTVSFETGFVFALNEKE